MRPQVHLGVSEKDKSPNKETTTECSKQDRGKVLGNMPASRTKLLLFLQKPPVGRSCSLQDYCLFLPQTAISPALCWKLSCVVKSCKVGYWSWNEPGMWHHRSLSDLICVSSTVVVDRIYFQAAQQARTPGPLLIRAGCPHQTLPEACMGPQRQEAPKTTLLS